MNIDVYMYICLPNTFVLVNFLMIRWNLRNPAKEEEKGWLETQGPRTQQENLQNPLIQAHMGSQILNQQPGSLRGTDLRTLPITYCFLACYFVRLLTVGTRGFL